MAITRLGSDDRFEYSLSYWCKKSELRLTQRVLVTFDLDFFLILNSIWRLNLEFEQENWEK